MSDLILTLWTLAFILGFALAIGWMVLPFALIGTKPLLKELIAETQKTNELLKQRVAPESSREESVNRLRAA